jgi:hypothetical protein
MPRQPAVVVANKPTSLTMNSPDDRGAETHPSISTAQPEPHRARALPRVYLVASAKHSNLVQAVQRLFSVRLPPKGGATLASLVLATGTHAEPRSSRQPEVLRAYPWVRHHTCDATTTRYNVTARPVGG